MPNIVGPNLNHMRVHVCSGTCRRELLEGRDCESGTCAYQANFVKEKEDGRVIVNAKGNIEYRQPQSF